MPRLEDPNDFLARKLCALMELVLEGDIQNEWECEFIESVVDRFEKGRDLTDAQVEKVNEIFGRHY